VFERPIGFAWYR